MNTGEDFRLTDAVQASCRTRYCFVRQTQPFQVSHISHADGLLFAQIKKPRIGFFNLCAGEDLNLHKIAPATTSR